MFTYGIFHNPLKLIVRQALSCAYASVLSVSRQKFNKIYEIKVNRAFITEHQKRIRKGGKRQLFQSRVDICIYTG